MSMDWRSRLKKFARLAAKAGVSSSGLVLDVAAEVYRSRLAEETDALVVEIEHLEQENARLREERDKWHECYTLKCREFDREQENARLREKLQQRTFRRRQVRFDQSDPAEEVKG